MTKNERLKKEFEILLAVGGRPIHSNLKSYALTPDKVEEWNFGLITDHGPPELQLDDKMSKEKERIQGEMPRFELEGKLASDPKKVVLTEVFKHPTVQSALDKYMKKAGGRSQFYPGNHQLTGSCVGSGSGNKCTIAAAVEVAYKGDLEIPIVFWWPFAYGRGRYRGGMRTPGEGSFSEAQSEAEVEDGNVSAEEEGLPVLKDEGDGLVLTASQERQWSDGDSSTVMPWLDKAGKHKFKQNAQIKSLDDARACIRDAKMPFMFCGSWGGLMQCPVKGTGDNQARVNRKSGSWAHNQTAIGWWDNPELGELWLIWNQWGNAHGMDPLGICPISSYWIGNSDMEYQIRGGSCIVTTGFNGFPALDLDLWFA